jgi:hypothetical protein
LNGSLLFHFFPCFCFSVKVVELGQFNFLFICNGTQKIIYERHVASVVCFKVVHKSNNASRVASYATRSFYTPKNFQINLSLPTDIGRKLYVTDFGKEIA